MHVRLSSYQFHLRWGLALFAAVLSACVTSSRSSTKVIGGHSDQTSYPATMMLLVTDAAGSASTAESCTGAWVRDDLFLTAAHCFLKVSHQMAVGQEFDRSQLRYVGTTYMSNVVHLHPMYQAINNTFDPHDIAIVQFPRATVGSGLIAPLATVTPGIGDQVTILGYGLFNFGVGLPGTRNIGSTTIAWSSTSSGGTINTMPYNPAQNVALALQGDSGGAMYNSNGEVVGVLSTVTATDDGSEHYNVYVNVNEPDNLAFIQKTSANALQNPLAATAMPSTLVLNLQN